MRATMTLHAAPERFDPTQARKDFPILRRAVNGRPLAYLDSAATSQKPRVVLDAIRDYYEDHNSNVHRGAHVLGEEATVALERSRETLAALVGAPSPDELVFVRNTTEALNIVARSYGGKVLRPGDRVVITEMEHHANLVPWQVVCRERGAALEYARITDEGRLDLDDLERRLSGGRVRIVSLAHVSNVLGTVNPIARVVELARAAGARVVLDAAQSVPHMPVDVRALGVDFLAASGHKMLGPMGIGFLWARRELLEEMDPFLYGGNMIVEVTFEGARWNEPPGKFEAGTAAVGEAVGLAAAAEYLTGLGLDAVETHSRALARSAHARLAAMPGVRVYGPPAEERAGLVSFSVEGIHPHDVAAVLDHYGVAVRAGHHCAQPLHKRLGVQATVRASFYLYNVSQEIDRLLEGVEAAQDRYIRRRK